MQEKWSLRLIRIAAIFGLIGTVLGSHMAGAGSSAFRPIHAHILLVGWLSLFAWGVFYKIYKVRAKKLVHVHGWTGNHRSNRSDVRYVAAVYATIWCE